MGDLPEFRELRELGAGAQGRVVLARHEPSGRVVAVKYLRGADPAAVSRFRDEALLLRRVQSPHVAALYDFRDLPGGGAIIMEAVEGVPLRAVLDAHTALSPEAALTVLKGSLLGLESAHRLGIVHRDYKPANVIVQADGRSKLIDFGVAVLAGGRGRTGTPPYMAPEQWTRGSATPATDVYAATCVFFECLTGRPPFRDGPLEELHTLAPIPVEEVPEPLRDLVARGMAKEASERPPSAQSFVAELEAAASTAYGPDWETRGCAVLGGMAAGLLGGVAMTALTGTTTTTATTTAPSTAGTGTGSTFLSGPVLTVFTAVLSVVVTAGVGVYAVPKLLGDSSPSRPIVAASTPPEPSLAYMTDKEVAVSTPAGEVKRIAPLSGRIPGGSLVWSGDGSLLAWTTAPRKGDPPDRVHLASADGGETRSWDCPDASCGTAVFRGNQLITGVSEDQRLTLYPAGGGAPESLPITGLPEASDSLTTVGSFLADATEKEVIIYYGVGTSAYGGPVAYYRVSETGEATEIFNDEDLANVAPSGVGLSPDHRSLTYVGGWRGGYCDERESVRLVDLSTGRVTEPEMPPGYLYVGSTWYNASGVLTATFYPQDASCPDADPSVPRGATRFELRSGAWVRVGRGAFVSRFAGDGSEARLAGEEPPAALTVIRREKTTKVRRVFLFAWSS